MLNLSSAVAKLGRAEFHLLQAQQIEASFLQSNPYATVREVNPEGRFRIRVTGITPRSNDLALLLGDAANCLRAGLDHIAFACVQGVLTPKEEKSIEFPICDTAQQFNSAMGTLTKRLRPDAVPLFEQFQPGPNPTLADNRFLAILREVNNRDKHRAISIFESLGKRLEVSPADSVIELETFVGRLEVGTILTSFKLKPGVEDDKVRVNTKLITVPVFGDVMPSNAVGESAITALVRAYNFTVENIVPKFLALP